jgi:predicted HicB family RNase H-like nuclease
MANFNVRVPDDLAARFDAWAGAQGGRSPALRHLIDRAAATAGQAQQSVGRLPSRPAKLTVRLAADDAMGLDAAAADAGLTLNAWAAALIRRRLHDRPTFRRSEEVTLLAVQTELRRIGVNVNQIARALNTGVLEGKVVDLEIAYLEDLRTEVRAHMFTLRQAFVRNLSYWDVES